MTPTYSLFMRQSYLDAWEDFNRSLVREDFPRWDYVVLTASNEAQAEAFRLQLEARREKGMLPKRTVFAVLPDPDGLRVGSGGATLNALKYIREREPSFRAKRVLCIHSGGDSKRVPQYSACGKLFSPVPRELPNGARSTLFDEFMIGMSGVPSRISEGMLVLSGDVLLLFNPLQIDAPSSGAAALSFKEDVETGKDHGVFHMDETGDVGEFLHKQPVETLKKRGAVNEQGKVDIDTGAVLLGADLLAALYSLVDTPEKFAAFVNDRARLSFYGDFLYPLASRSTREQFYREKPEGDFTPELRACRTAVWDALHAFRMRLLRLSPAAFIHFGTTRELRALMTEDVKQYAFLDWKRCVLGRASERYALNNVVVEHGCEIGADCYLEDSYVLEQSRVGAGAVLSHVTVRDREVPADVALHGLRLCDGRFVVRVYGVGDNPKEATFLGEPLARLGEWPSLWEAEIYPVCGTLEQAVDAALNLYALARGEGDRAAWETAERTSLRASFNAADTRFIIDWEASLRETAQAEALLEIAAREGTAAEAAALFKDGAPSERQRRLIEEKAARAMPSARMRVWYDLGRILSGTSEGEDYMRRAFAEIRNIVLSGAAETARVPAPLAPAKDEITVRLPLRVNWGGGWTDTPPYCNEKGGAVLNAAILLNHDYPVEVRVRRLDRPVVVLESADLNAYGEFDSIAALQDCHNPYDSFALHKAALIACGVIPREGGALEDVLAQTGGLYLSTFMRNVPKGSGLGTSSILAGACAKALYEYFAIPHTDGDLYDCVMCMEQIMSTGGGWQDQVGGMTPGVKFILSAPGAKQRLRVRHIELAPETKRELDERFALIYTGQRRLARNLLRDVVGRYIGGVAESLAALEEIQRVAAMMSFELERGNVDGFAALLNRHWDLSRAIDSGSTNTCIDQIFNAIDDLIDGRMICGAGGGGFLQVILKKNVTREQLSQRLHETFQDCGVDVWECELA